MGTVDAPGRGLPHHRAGRISPAELAALAREHLSPAGQAQITTALQMLAVLDAELDVTRRRLLAAARQLRGARVLAASLYGVGPVTALALTCWLGGAGRFTSARKAVRFTGLDVTVCSSACRPALARAPVPAGAAAAALGPV